MLFWQQPSAVSRRDCGPAKILTTARLHKLVLRRWQHWQCGGVAYPLRILLSEMTEECADTLLSQVRGHLLPAMPKALMSDRLTRSAGRCHWHREHCPCEQRSMCEFNSCEWINQALHQSLTHHIYRYRQGKVCPCHCGCQWQFVPANVTSCKVAGCDVAQWCNGRGTGLQMCDRPADSYHWVSPLQGQLAHDAISEAFGPTKPKAGMPHHSVPCDRQWVLWPNAEWQAGPSAAPAGQLGDRAGEFDGRSLRAQEVKRSVWGKEGNSAWCRPGGNSIEPSWSSRVRATGWRTRRLPHLKRCSGATMLGDGAARPARRPQRWEFRIIIIYNIL